MRMFAKIDGIPGESTDAKHKGEIDVLSFSWGLSSPAPSPGGGVGVGRPAFQHATFSHVVDKASPLLAQSCALGQHHKVATITQRRDGGKAVDFLQFKFEDVVVTAVTDAGPADQPLAEQVQLAYAKVHLAYFPQKADGSLEAPVTFAFDVAANRKI
jgi:type VI secretion system secreted protein Hcp